MTLMTVPPAQAEALFDAHHDYDTQDGLRDDCWAGLRCGDKASGLAWRDDDNDELHVISSPLGRLPRPVPSFGPAR